MNSTEQISNRNFAMLNTIKLFRGSRGRHTLNQSLRHLEQIEMINKIPLQDTVFNSSKVFFNRKDLQKIIKEKIAEHNANNKRPLRNDASIAIEIIVSFSSDLEGKIDMQKWIDENLKFIKNEFINKGGIPIRYDLHTDEKPSHIHFIFLATTNEGKISANQHLGDYANLSKIQTRYANAMEQFGMKRGYSRFDEYNYVQSKAEQEGYGSDTKGVAEYCHNHKIEVPLKITFREKCERLKQLNEEIGIMKNNP